MTLRVSPDEIVERSTSPLLRIAEHWERVPLGWVADITNGAPFKSPQFNTNGTGMPLIRIRDVGSENTKTFYDGEYESRHVVKPGDLLVGMDGDFRVARWHGPTALLNQRVCRIAVTDASLFDSRFLGFVIQPYLNAVHELTSAVTVKHLSSRTIAELPIPLPPLPEQRRIVTVLEEHLSRLEAAEAEVRSATRLLDRFWESTLDQSFRSSWPRPPLDELNQKNRPICYGILKPKTQGVLEVPYVEVRSIKNGRIEVEGLHKTTREMHNEFRRSELADRDVVLAIRGSFDRAAVVPNMLSGANVSRDVARIAPDSNLVPEFLAHFLESREAMRFFKSRARGVAVQGINIGDLRKLPVPAPCVPEQEAAVEHIEQVAEQREAIRRELHKAQVRASHLRRSLLAAAFSGQLVAQDPSDEPASVLLERIVTERAASEPPRRKKQNAS